MSVWNRGIALAVMLLIGTLSVGSTPVRGQSDTRPAIRVRLQFANPGGIYDPARQIYTSDYFTFPSMYNYLVRWKPGTDGSVLEPDLADHYTVSPDGKTFTFVLRKGVQFQKGFGELTSDDVVFTFQRQMQDSHMSYYQQSQQIARVEAVDRYTVRIVLKQPNAAFLSTYIAFIPGFIVSKKAVLQYGDEFAKNPIGTGPYAFGQLTAGREVIVTANDQFFRGRPVLRQITFAPIPDETVAAEALLRGEFQVIWTRGNAEAVKLLTGAQGITTQPQIVYDSLRQVAFTTTFKPAQDVRVRQALSYAINRQQISAALPGLEVPTDVVRTNKLFGGSLNVMRYPYNPDKARELLKEAGYPNGFHVSLMFQTRDPESILASIVQSNWHDVGIDVTLDPTEPVRAFDRRLKGDFEATVVSEGRPADPDLSYTSIFYSKIANTPDSGDYIGYSGGRQPDRGGTHRAEPPEAAADLRGAAPQGAGRRADHPAVVPGVCRSVAGARRAHDQRHQQQLPLGHDRAPEIAGRLSGTPVPRRATRRGGEAHPVDVGDCLEALRHDLQRFRVVVNEDESSAEPVRRVPRRPAAREKIEHHVAGV